ncbi:alpha/beta hydrolase [Pelagibius litoralis]|uniref:Alpha/beta hydrolase n=1 Tax=Pelagibius litoralis TaxID=374515 RepID=A0A967KAP2_9PROT|nr:alpha/beta hydrolase [Pelagibius litoralis]NIA71743.1 alpha/beta hydrolase [Pelagibius litoralis]
MVKDFSLVSGKATLSGVEAGEGPALVFLHAGVADRRMWQDQIAAFAGSHRVIAYDRRGFGETRYEAETFSHVDDLLAVLDQQGITSAVLVGCSQGGRIAIDFTLTHPGRVGGLFLVAPSVTGAPRTEDFPPAVEAVLELLEEAEEEEDLDRINLLEAWLWLDGPASEEGRVGGPARDLFLVMNDRALHAPDPGRETNPAAFPVAYSRLADLGVPAQVVWGDADFPHLQQRCVHVVQAMPQALGTVIPGTAHLPNMEQPETFNGHLREFLEGL